MDQNQELKPPAAPTATAPTAQTQPAVAHESKTKMVKIRAKSTIRVDGKMVNAGTEVHCTPEEAKDLCTVIQGHFTFAGQRYNGDEMPRHKIQRAEYVR